MFRRRSDLSIQQDSLNSFLPWLIAFMVFLSMLALAGALVLHQVAARWERGITATLTVQVPAGADAAEDDRRMARAVALLRDTPGVRAARPIDADQVAKLLAPWLGEGGDSRDLPLPRLIDVTLKDGFALDAARLQQQLATVLPGAAIDDHRLWLDRVVRMMRASEALAFGVVGLIALTCIGTVTFTTRTGLAVHHEAIQVMHLIGAQDSYVARQFAQRALGLGLRGGLLGVALAAPVLYGAGLLAERLPPGLLPDAGLEPAHWAILAVPPVAAALIAMATARLTVIRTLGRMP